MVSLVVRDVEVAKLRRFGACSKVRVREALCAVGAQQCSCLTLALLGLPRLRASDAAIVKVLHRCGGQTATADSQELRSEHLEAIRVVKVSAAQIQVNDGIPRKGRQSLTHTHDSHTRDPESNKREGRVRFCLCFPRPTPAKKRCVVGKVDKEGSFVISPFMIRDCPTSLFLLNR